MSVSGLSPNTSVLAVSANFSSNWSSGAQTPFTSSGRGNLYFRRAIHFQFLSEFYFRSDFYIRDSDGTTATPRL